MASRPNILWICTDQQRFDTIHALGNNHIRTPNLDRLVGEGVSFTNAYCQNPVCSPSRASFLTGRYPRTTLVRQNGQEKFPESEKLVTKMFADAGYDCGLVGKLHLSAAHGRKEPRPDDGYRYFQFSHDPFPLWPIEDHDFHKWIHDKGYTYGDVYPVPDEYWEGYGKGGGISEVNGSPVYAGFPTELHQSTWCTEKAIEFIEQDRDEPWLLSINYYDPHHPFDPPEEYLKRYNPDDLPGPKYKEGELEHKPIFQQIDHNGAYGGHGVSFADTTDRQHREIIAAYYAMIELLDDCVGKLLDTLEKTGQRENTLIVYMSDHGEMLGDHGIYCKGTHFYEGAVRVPLILNWPGNFSPNTRHDAMVELTDVAPTLLEASGLPRYEGMQGTSFLQACTNPEKPFTGKEQVYCEYYNSTRAYNKQGGAYGTMIRDKRYKVVVYHGTEFGELYDLEQDPDEFVNLWNDPKHSEVKNAMIRKCLDATVFTMDPLPKRIAAF